MRKRAKTLAVLSVLGLAVVGLLAGPGSALAKDFYGKRDVIELVVPSKPGGGFDAVGRFMAQNISMYAPGTPKVQVVNIPAGGGIHGGNDFEIRKADGYSLFEAGGSIMYPYLLGRKEVQYDFSKYQPIFALPENSIVLLSTKSGIKTAKDLLTAKDGSLFYGLDNPTSDVRYLLAFELLGITDKIKNVYGYGGITSRAMAVKQGEIDVFTGTAKWYEKKFMPLVKEGDGVNLFQFGTMNNEGNFVGDPNIPLPTVQELYKEFYGKEPSGQVWEAFQLFAGSVSKLGMGTFVKGDVPPEALDGLKQAAQKAMADPEFHAQLKKILGEENILAGDELDATYAKMLKAASDEKLISWTKDWLIKRHGAQGLE